MAQITNELTNNPVMDGTVTKVYVVTCADCGKTFEITGGEKEWYDQMGFPLPKRCSSCRKCRKAMRRRTEAARKKESENVDEVTLDA